MSETNGEAVPITGTLKNARLVLDGDPRCPCIHGRVYDDTKGRFHDGEWIWTSTLLEHLPGSVFRTRYSTYRVEGWQ